MKNGKRKTAGFTLVELIVVIAILAILAGVGTVAYSGYVKKANQAVDQQLNAEIAYAGELGSYQNPGVVGYVSVYHQDQGRPAEVSNETIGEWMAASFGADWPSILHYISAAYADGMKVTVPGGVVVGNLSEELLNCIANFSASNMSGHEEELARSADNLADLFSEWIESSGINALSGYFDLGENNEGEFDAFKATYGLDENSTPTEVANATVLYVASKASTMDAEVILADAMRMEPFDLMAAHGALPTAALMYGVMTGYANSDYASDDFKAAYAVPPTGISEVVGLFNVMMNETDINSYMQDPDNGVLADMNGYLGAMQVIDEYSDSFDRFDDDAFVNDSTLALLAAILGSSNGN